MANLIRMSSIAASPCLETILAMVNVNLHVITKPATEMKEIAKSQKITRMLITNCI